MCTVFDNHSAIVVHVVFNAGDRKYESSFTLGAHWWIKHQPSPIYKEVHCPAVGRYRLSQ